MSETFVNHLEGLRQTVSQRSSWVGAGAVFGVLGVGVLSVSYGVWLAWLVMIGDWALLDDLAAGSMGWPGLSVLGAAFIKGMLVRGLGLRLEAAGIWVRALSIVVGGCGLVSLGLWMVCGGSVSAAVMLSGSFVRRALEALAHGDSRFFVFFGVWVGSIFAGVRMFHVISRGVI